MVGETTIPLFPLEVVLMPSMPLPLHIFEERYKLMIGECLEQKREFGVVYQKGSDMKKIGCTARIVQVLRRFDDGRLDIMTQGAERFVIESINEDKPYLQAEVIYFDDEREKGADNLIADGIKLLEALDGMTGKKRDYRSLSRMDRKTISFVICYNDVFSMEEKQSFLEMTSTSERIRKGVDSLRKAVELMQITEEIRRIAGGNGDLRSK
ncbi:MAG: LON peptidase substrate-binding domain-containing protein [Deltaproteobacteria bacterium]|nr:MAG: LON peptidase substrate-binding domain-containing protein [Deltaproteobacteria bacterium]